MNIDLFFKPVEESVVKGARGGNSWADLITIHVDTKPDWKAADIVLFGVPESRGSLTNEGASLGPNEVREKLYRLKRGVGAYSIVDLGDLNVGQSREDTCDRIKEVSEAIMQSGGTPVIIGGTQDLDYGQYLSYEYLDKLISCVNVDASFDVESLAGFGGAKHHVKEIILHQPSFLLHYGHVAYQSYLVDPEVLKVFEKLNFDKYRLGEVRDDLAEMEPVMRFADMVTFDMSAIRRSDAPGNENAQPFGLSGEEACQLTWYAGLSDNISSIGFYEFNPSKDNDGQTAQVLATMIWYFVEGFYSRVDDLQFQSDKYTTYVVSSEKGPNRVTFYKSNQSGKWWMEISKGVVYPCSLNDYEKAKQGELPDRYIQAASRLT